MKYKAFLHLSVYQNLAQQLRNLSRPLKSTRSIDRTECFRAEAYLNVSALMKKSIPSMAWGVWIPRQHMTLSIYLKQCPLLRDKNLIPLQTLKMNAPSMTIVNSKQFKGNDKFDFELDKYD